MSYFNTIWCNNNQFRQSDNAIKLQTLFREIKYRFAYILFSFLLSFAIAYKNKNVLLYLFILSYTKKDVDNFFLDSFFKEIKKETEEENFSYIFINKENTVFLKKELMENSDLFFFAYGNNNQYFSKLKDSWLINFSKIIDSVDCSSVQFIFTDVEEAFSSQILICLIYSFVLVLPLFIYNLLAFFVPSLYFYESKKWIVRSFIFIIGWSYFITIVQNKIIPRFSAFLLDFSINTSAFNVIAETKIYSYCNWAFSIFLITNLILLFFCFIFFLIKSEKIKIEFLKAHRKSCNMILLLFSAFIAPPDLLTQLILTLFLIFFFETFLFFFSIYKYLLYYKSIADSEI